MILMVDGLNCRVCTGEIHATKPSTFISYTVSVYRAPLIGGP